MESSISGIVPGDTPLISGAFTDRSLIAEHGIYVLVKAKRLGKWFKLKALSGQFASDGHHMELLKKEFELGFPLEHPNVVRTYDFVRDSELGDCIVQEYVQGARLDEWLPTASKKARRRAVGQILDAMAYFHGQGVVHRDLKPSNILITDNGADVKIIDFGLSDADRYAILKQPAGTSGFSSPEQMVSGGSDVRSDIYSFGRILPMFHLGGVYSRIARKASASDPKKRYANVEEIRSEIHRAHIPAIVCGSIILLLLVLAGVFVVVTYQRKVVTLNEKVAMFEAEVDSLELVKSKLIEANVALTEANDSFSQMKSRQQLLEDILGEVSAEVHQYYDKMLEIVRQCNTQEEFWAGVDCYQKANGTPNEMWQSLLRSYSTKYSLDLSEETLLAHRIGYEMNLCSYQWAEAVEKIPSDR